MKALESKQNLSLSLSLSLSPFSLHVREKLAQEAEKTKELLVDLGSDQTSLHNPFGGGYYPVQLSFDKANTVMENDPARFKKLVQERWVEENV